VGSPGSTACGQRSGAPSGPPPGGGFKTKIDRYCDLVTVNVFYENSRLKQNLKDGVALRIETVINGPKLTCAVTASCRICPSWRARHVRSTPACWRLKPPARARHL
jgi:hypothetical protein